MKAAVRLVMASSLAAVFSVYVLQTLDLERKSYGEGPILAMAERMRNEQISSAWLKGPDYTLSCYGPAYYYVCEWAERIGGWRHSILPGRLVSLAASLTIAALAAVVAARQTHSIELGLLASLAFVASPTVAYWMPYARVDMLALLASLGAYASLGTSRRNIVAAAALLAAGSLAKPTAALSALPILAHLTVCRRRRDALVFAICAVAFAAGAWSVVHWSSDGFFSTAVWNGNRNRMIPWRGFAFGYQFLCSPLGTSAMIAAAYMLITEPAKAVRSLWCLGFLLSYGTSVATVCKHGSDQNYFLETALLASMVVATAAQRLASVAPGRALTALSLLALVVGVPWLRECKHRARAVVKPCEEYVRVQSWLRDEPADVGLLADGECVDVALAAGQRPWVNDSFIYMLLVDNGTLDEQELVNAIKYGRIKWLLLHSTLDDHLNKTTRASQVWPAGVIGAMQEHFELVEHVGETYVYRHRP
jgi:hypothetical protein